MLLKLMEFKPIEDFGFPITLAFSKNGRIFLSERITGRLWEVELNFENVDQQKSKLLITFPVTPIIGHNEAGFIGIALDPEFEVNGFIYCYYTYGNDINHSKNKVVKVKVGRGEEQVILDNIPAGLIHNGGIMAFAPDQTLYLGVGVGNDVKDDAQDINTLNGKILRINLDGSIPEDNPFPNSPVYSYGHRNIFGLAFHPKTSKLYISEEGPDKNDEINIIEKGGNYGWPMVTGIVNNPNYIDPIKTYTPTITPTQNVFVGKDLYFSSFNEGTVHKLTLGGDSYNQVLGDEIVFKSKPFGLVGAFYGPDKYFYATSSNQILKFSL